MERFYPFLFVFLWSTGFIGAKFGLPYAEPLSFLLTRYGLVLGLMTVVALVTRAPWPAKARDWLHIGVSGVLVHAVYLGGVFVAIKHGQPVLGAGAFGRDVVAERWPRADRGVPGRRGPEPGSRRSGCPCR